MWCHLSMHTMAIPPEMVQVRAGTGGDEAALFAGDLLRMYERASALNGWKFEVGCPRAASMTGIVCLRQIQSWSAPLLIRHTCHAPHLVLEQQPLGLLLGTEASVMAPSGIDFSLLFRFHGQHQQRTCSNQSFLLLLLILLLSGFSIHLRFDCLSSRDRQIF